MRALTIIVLAAVTACGPAGLAWGQAAPERRVTADFQLTPLHQALERLFQGTGVTYRVEANVPDVAVTVILRDVSLEAALRALTRTAARVAPGVSYVSDGGGYVIRVQDLPRAAVVPAEGEAAGKRVTLALQDAPLRGAIHQFFRSPGVPYRLAEHVPDTPITLHVRDAPFGTALSLLTGLAALQVPDFTVEEKDGVYVLGVKLTRGGLAQGIEEHFPDPTDRRYSYAKLPVRYQSVAALSYMLGAPLLPTEADLLGGYGGYGGGFTSRPYGFNGYNSYPYGGGFPGYGSYPGGYGPRSLDFGGYYGPPVR